MAFERLTGLPSADPELKIGQFLPGPETTDTVCNVTTLTDPTDRLGVRATVEIFLGRHGTELLRIAGEKQAQYEKLQLKENDLAAAIMAELGASASKDQAPDIFDAQVLELVVRPNRHSGPNRRWQR